MRLLKHGFDWRWTVKVRMSQFGVTTVKANGIWMSHRNFCPLAKKVYWANKSGTVLRMITIICKAPCVDGTTGGRRPCWDNGKPSEWVWIRKKQDQHHGLRATKVNPKT